jgi:Tetratricopeptide repeat
MSRRAAARAPRPSSATTAPPLASSHAGHAAVAIAIVLAALVLLRGLVAFSPTMWGWGIDAQRFLPPLLGWSLWLLAALALVPPLAHRMAPAFARAGDALARGRLLATLAWMAAAMAVVILLPDRLWHVGDFLLRKGMVEIDLADPAMFIQAGPLDQALHNALPRFLAHHLPLDANGAGRLMGAVEAGVLAWLSLRFARVLDLRGTPAFATAAVVVCGGYLGMFTGYSKAFSEMVVLTAAVGVFGLEVLRGRNRLLPLGLAVALGLTLHRSAIGFLPALVAAWAVWFVAARRESRLGSTLRDPAMILGLALPLAALVWMAPRLLATLTGYDAVTHYATAEVRASGGILSAAFAGWRSLDLANLFVMLSPVAIVVPVAFAGLGLDVGPRRSVLFLLLLALLFVIALPLVVHPSQGIFRDWDDFAASGMALSLLAAWCAGAVLREAPRHAWVGVGIFVVVVTSSLSWLALQALPTAGLARVRAYAVEPPHRTGAELGLTWEYIGMFEYQRGQWDASAAALARAVEATPSPTIFRYWALSEAQAGRPAVSQEIYHRLLGRDPANLAAWYSLAAVSTQDGDYAEARRALEQLLRVAPGDTAARARLGEINQYHPGP